MTKPQTIQIFLPDGSPTSIREAEITNRLVNAEGQFSDWSA